MAKVYEILTVYKPLLVAMTRQGISQDDIIYLEMYREYVRMSKEGQKETQVWAFLSEKYKLPASAIKKAVRRLDAAYELL